jgi:hypothetical protein
MSISRAIVFMLLSNLLLATFTQCDAADWAFWTTEDKASQSNVWNIVAAELGTGQSQLHTKNP